MATTPSKRDRREAARRASQRRRTLRWGAVAAVLAIAIASVVLFTRGGGDPVSALAPDFELDTPDGDTVRLSDLRGQPVAVTFMHTY